MVHFNGLICSISLYNLLWNFICHARANFLDLPCSTEIELSGVSRTSLLSININSYRLYLTFFDYSVTFYFYSEIFSKEFPIKWNTRCAIHNNLFVMKFMILNLLLISYHTVDTVCSNIFTNPRGLLFFCVITILWRSTSAIARPPRNFVLIINNVITATIKSISTTHPVLPNRLL